MLDIEHLFENIITTMDTGGDLLALEQHPITQHMLNNVNATFDEILSIAMYVKHTYCQACEREANDYDTHYRKQPARGGDARITAAERTGCTARTAR